MWPDRVSNPEPLTYESGALPIALSGPASIKEVLYQHQQEVTNIVSMCKWWKNIKLYIICIYYI